MSIPHGRSEGMLSPWGMRRAAAQGADMLIPHGRSEGMLTPLGGRAAQRRKGLT